MSDENFKVTWYDGGREPTQPSNPAYPDGIDIDVSEHGKPFCELRLDYPAKRCGRYWITCELCGLRTVVTTAGRRDDPRSIKMACKLD